jgi:transposase
MNLVRENVKLYLVTGKVDLRMGIDGYAALVQNRLGMNVFENAMFLFCNRNHDKLKILYWDKTGFWLFYKRLEKGNHFKWIRDDENHCVSITEEQYGWLMQGLKIEQKKSIIQVRKKCA